MQIYRYRLVFSRNQIASNMSHLEQINFFRNFLNINLPYLIKDKKISFGPAISQGYESLAEYIDVYLNKRVSLEDLNVIFIKIKDRGFELLEAKSIPLFFPSIESSVEISEYELWLKDFDENIIINSMLSNEQKELFYEKIINDGTLKKINIKDFIYNYKIDNVQKNIIIYIKHINGKTIKPEVILKVFFKYEGEVIKKVRKAFYWIDSKGKLNVL